MNPSIELVVAAAENHVIGRDGDLPWHLPADLRHFKRLTVGQTVILGRRTFESIVDGLGRPLPKRRSIVLSRDAGARAELVARWGVEAAPDLDAALDLASDAECVFIIGGARVYADALPQAETLHLTRVHAEIDGDVEFPPIDRDQWCLDSSERHEIDERHEHAFTFERYSRLG